MEYFVGRDDDAIGMSRADIGMVVDTQIEEASLS
jgi:hypothetical protein